MVVAFGQILPRAVIDIAPRGTVNVHASLLPRLRGAAPIQWAIANGDTETGVTTMQIDEGLDTGPLLLSRALPIGPDETAAELEPRLARLGGELLVETLAGLEHGTLQPVPQDAGRATHAPLLTKEDGRVDWSLPAHAIACRARGFHPWPGAFTHARGAPAQAAARPRGRARAQRARAGPGERGRRRRASPWRAAAARCCGSRKSSPRAAGPCRPRPGRRARACGPACGSAERGLRGAPGRALACWGGSRRGGRSPRRSRRPRPASPTRGTARCSTSSCSARCDGAAGWTTSSSRLSSRPLDTLAPAVRDALRLGAYQLLFLRTPAHAAVSESVDLAREREPHAAGFVNAILRRLQREGPPPEPDPASDPVGWMSTAGSLPRWLAERWHARLGPADALARARAALEAPPTFVRLNPRVASARDELAKAGVELAACDVPGAFRASEGALGAFAERGLVYVQDAGSQLVAQLAAAEGRAARRVRGARGQGAAALGPGAGPDARGRGRGVPEAARFDGDTRASLGCHAPAAAGGRRAAASLPRRASTPSCSTPRAAASARSRATPTSAGGSTPQDVERHAARQRSLLESTARLVRPGGRLVYATCSLEAEETHQVVDAFLAANPAFGLDELPDWARPFAHEGRVVLDPARHPGDGFFAVRLRRGTLVSPPVMRPPRP